MPKYIATVGTLDTKGDQVEYLSKKIQDKGQHPCVIDLGVSADGPFKPDFNRHQVAQAAGTSIEGILAMNNRRAGLEKMGEGAANIIRELYNKGELSGVIAVGGSQGTAVSLLLMKTIPIGIPKLILSTIAYSRNIVPDMLGGVNLMMLPWVAGLWGLNSLSKQSLETAAVAIASAARVYEQRPAIKKKIIGISSLGGAIQRYVDYLKPALEGRGYEVAVFHSLGMPGRMFEQAISEGYIEACLDLSVGSELINEINGGVYTAGKHRLEAAGKMGIPQIVSPGGTEVFMWGNDRPLPNKYKNRPRMWHSALHMSIDTTAREVGAVGTLMAEKLNMAKGPTVVVFPLQGIGWKPGSLFSSPERAAALQNGLAAFRRNIKAKLNSNIKYIELDVDFNDPIYLDTVLEVFDDMMKK
jgi:uncharacterized protein (UPF0261 family)